VREWQRGVWVCRRGRRSKRSVFLLGLSPSLTNTPLPNTHSAAAAAAPTHCLSHARHTCCCVTQLVCRIFGVTTSLVALFGDRRVCVLDQVTCLQVMVGEGQREE
jgi:hypothetical protein